MSQFRHGFASELVKLGGVLSGLGGLGRLVVKHPMASLGVAGILGSTAAAASHGLQEGASAGGRPRYLAASPEGPSEAAYTNYHQLFEHKPRADQLRALHWNYRPEAFKR